MNPPIEPLTPGDERFRLLVESVQDYAIFMLDPSGRVLSWNAGAQRLKGYAADEIIGRSFETFYPPAAIAAGWPRQELELAAERGRFEDEGWRLRKDGSRFWANVVLTALREPDGALSGYAKVTRDLTERREHEELLRRSEEQFRLLLESVTDYAIFMLDTEGRVLTWNTGAQAIKGYAAAEVLGRHFSLFFGPEDLAVGLPETELRTALAQGRAQSEGWRLRRDGQKFWANVVLTPIYDSEGLLRGFAKATRDLTEQRRVADLERSTRHLQEFIAMLAHELRNPLAPIRNAVGILQRQAETDELPPRVVRMGEIIGRQLGQLTRLVDDLLDIGRIATGKIVLRPQALDFREVVTLSVEAARPAMDQRRHEFQLDLPEGPLPLRGDLTRLAQALQNLLQNAARYTPDGGRVALRVSSDGRQLRAEVRDNGIGLAAEAHERIFELFRQELTGHGGLGIGLSLARTLVQQHGGRLEVHSEGLGQGSCFTLSLPVAGAPAAMPASDADAGPAGEGLRVLVIDDNRDSADTMVELLKSLGHEARAVYGAGPAVAAAVEFMPALVLLDLNMPDGDGYSVIKGLREATGAASPFVVAMTGYGQPRDLARTRAAGFDMHLTKPVTFDDVLSAIDAQRTRVVG